MDEGILAILRCRLPYRKAYFDFMIAKKSVSGSCPERESMRINELNQPIGEQLDSFAAGKYPSVTQIIGEHCMVEKLAKKHLADLYAVYGPKSPKENWTYMAIDPFEDYESYQSYMQKQIESRDPCFFAILDKKSGKVVGTFALMRIDVANRVIEMGWIVYSKAIQRTRISTEVQYLMMKYVFEELQYRRYEWKCDSLNEPSVRAAKRLGFHYEGTFRQAMVYKGRNRDTAWFSILDNEWPMKKDKLKRWLSDDNFDENGRQKKSLSEI